MDIAIIKYNAGNVQSVKYALDRLGVKYRLTDNASEIMSADKVIFPGVGEASTAMNYLKENGLDTVLRSLSQPTLGVCLGLQLMCRHTEENDTECLGVFDIDVKRFKPDPNAVISYKIPHMGWNKVAYKEGPLFDGMGAEPYFYFVHSYYAPLSKYTVASANYMHDFSVVIQRNNFYAIQPHPEKSADAGSLFLKNFIENIK
ncbi:imidazole glycerol phosphate synthase subunit HisH [Mangrovivirga cuniculi]|uniref:Imidazole glycerol phosphate synthase subunit HisH n=1 Tax=Mangrovivirga cuniculi TaxID=2715131 RepID=A0A4D7JZ72_9BACT|nr:imidazole glycerol phosphate synthase subunit HisH [Mangrovivirga cuniculi]QCK16005.1 imidazole glycerol phosphate synthase subunit HisH [Mangrovivirga cuniculi]